MYASAVPESCSSGEEVMLGIDEAGRGPVLGPLVYAAAYWAIDQDPVISKMGFDDSKALTDDKRRGLFDRLKQTATIGYVVDSISADTLSREMLRRLRPVSLNIISHDSAIRMIRKVINLGVNVTAVFVDTVGDPGNYEKKLNTVFRDHSPKIRFKVAKKADSLYKTVSAASICAKVSRDMALGDWVWEEPLLRPPVSKKYPTTTQTQGSSDGDMAATVNIGDDIGNDDNSIDLEGEGGGERPTPSPSPNSSATPSIGFMRKLPPIATDKEYGSGYPGDARCSDWLKRNMDKVFGWPSLVRFGWGTAKELLKEPGTTSGNADKAAAYGRGSGGKSGSGGGTSGTGGGSGGAGGSKKGGNGGGTGVRAVDPVAVKWLADEQDEATANTRSIRDIFGSLGGAPSLPPPPPPAPAPPAATATALAQTPVTARASTSSLSRPQHRPTPGEGGGPSKRQRIGGGGGGGVGSVGLGSGSGSGSGHSFSPYADLACRGQYFRKAGLDLCFEV